MSRCGWVVLLLVVTTHPARAADCAASEISLASQAQVDQFQSQYGPCTTLTGSLTISGLDIVDLDGLAGLVGVERLFITSNPALTSLAGLSSLTSVSEALWIQANPALASLFGLHRLKRVDGSLLISGNDALANLSRLSALERVGEAGLFVGSNPRLESLAGLRSLVTVSGDLSIAFNPALTAVDGLGALRSVGGLLTIRGNEALGSLAGLPSLETVGGSVEVLSNPSLTALGFGPLESVGLRVEISGNPALASIAGLQSIVGLRELVISGSHALTDLDGLASLREVTDSLVISSNTALGDVDGLDSITKAGSVVIVANASLGDVDGLTGLTVIDGDVAIGDNDSLTSIEGLANVTTVAGGLSIYDNPRLDDLRGLGSVKTVGSLAIVSLPLTTLDDLRSLESVSLQLAIVDNPKLSSLAALHRVEEVQWLSIEFNDALVDMRGLGGLGRVGFLGVTISGNDSLRRLAGLDSLVEIDGDLRIGSSGNGIVNRVLSSLDGLGSLARVGGSVRIERNPLLAEVDDLADLLAAGSLSVLFNQRLGDCSGLARLVDAVDDPPEGPGSAQSPAPDVASSLELVGNAAGCNSIAEIEAAPPDSPCVRDAETACLLDDRFRVRADLWDFANGPTGPGALHRGQVQTYDGARAESDLSVGFYAFEEGNVELFVKMIDACPLPFHAFWVFAAGATTAEAEVEVLDTWTGERFRVFNPRRAKFTTATGTTAFATCDAPPP